MPRHGDKFDAHKKDAYLEKLRKGLRRGAAAKSVGVSRGTVWEHFRDDEVFRGAVLQAELDACEIIEDALFNTAKRGNVTAQQVWLYNRHPQRWKDQRNLKVSVGDDDIDSAIRSELDKLADRGQGPLVGQTPGPERNGHSAQ